MYHLFIISENWILEGTFRNVADTWRRASEQVLLGQSFPGLYTSYAVMEFLNSQFLHHDFTSAVFRRGLQVGP